MIQTKNKNVIKDTGRTMVVKGVSDTDITEAFKADVVVKQVGKDYFVIPTHCARTYDNVSFAYKITDAFDDYVSPRTTLKKLSETNARVLIDIVDDEY